MEGYIANIEKETEQNQFFRKVLFTGPHLQLVVMSLLPGEDIGMEIHDKEDQFIRVETGHAVVVMNGIENTLSADMVVVIPAGVEHNIINTSDSEPLKLYTIYCEKHHPDGTIHPTKADAIAAEMHEHH